MKLSGAFSELPAQHWDAPSCLENLVKSLKPWTDVAFDTFGPSHIMFRSDWPVCNVGGPGVEQQWRYWRDIVDAILSARDLFDHEKSMVCSGTSKVA